LAAYGLHAKGYEEMKFFKKMKDGGAESTVTGYWLIEIKCLFSIVLLKFEGRSREAFHTHAFNCWNWLIKGVLKETKIDGKINYYSSKGSTKFFKIGRDDFHKVDSLMGTSWLLSFRGPWSDTWEEYLPHNERFRILTHGRKEVL
jgi:hypothetical protein